ncbi:MAG: periplasmic heavy metal sensor [Kiritimatiellae bacterium]|nr:periplasmic heavy metal sensor [Kiritimatiellia bacterium]
MNAHTPDKPAEPAAQPAPRRRGRWRPILLSAAIFICGGVVGGVLTVGLVHRAIMKGPRHPERAPDLASRHLQRRLKLTDEQRQQVETILKKRFSALRAIREEQIELVDKEVAELLDEEQLEKWGRICQKFRHRFGSGEHHGPPPPGPPPPLP